METIHFKKLQLKNNVRIANRLKQRVALLADDYDLSLDQINSEIEKRLLHFKDNGVADIEYMLNQYGIGLKKDIRLHRCVFQKTNAFSLEKRALRQSEKRTLQKTDINHQAEVREIFISKQQALEEKERLILAQLEQKLTLKNLDEEIRLQASIEVENCYMDLYEAMKVERNRLREMADKKREQLKKQFLKQKEKLQKRLSLVQTKLKTYAEMEGIRTSKLIEQLRTALESELDVTKKADIQSKLDDLNALKQMEMPDSDIHLEISHLTMRFGGLKAVDDLSFQVKKGEVFGLIGPNGAGKTTVFNCITQFYKPPQGQIYFKGRSNEVISLKDYKVHQIIKEGIVRTFQNVELVWELTILDNLLVGAHTLYQSSFFTQLFHLPRLKREEELMRKKALSILDTLGLMMYKDAYPLGIPYGILKKVELARTLMTNPDLIILDEPAAGLNDMETKELIRTIRRIQQTFHCTIFLVEHDMELVMDICDTICAISFGKKIAIGSPPVIQQNKQVQEAYLGGE